MKRFFPAWVYIEVYFLQTHLCTCVVSRSWIQDQSVGALGSCFSLQSRSPQAGETKAKEILSESCGGFNDTFQLSTKHVNHQRPSQTNHRLNMLQPNEHS